MFGFGSKKYTFGTRVKITKEGFFKNAEGILIGIVLRAHDKPIYEIALLTDNKTFSPNVETFLESDFK